MTIKAIFSNISMYAYLVCASIILTLFVHNSSLKKDVKILNLQLNRYHQQIDNLEEKSKLFSDKVNLAESKAYENIKRDIEKADNILSENVSNDCDKAITWGKEQAAKI